MKHGTYLQRLITRMGMPAARAASPVTSHLMPPDAPIAPVYDPFSEPEEIDEVLPSPPVTVEPREAKIPPPPVSQAEEKSMSVPRELGRETIVERMTAPPEPQELKPLPEEVSKISPERAAPLSVHPFESEEEIILPSLRGNETVERLVREIVEPLGVNEPLSQPLPGFEQTIKPPPPIIPPESVSYTFIEPPGGETPSTPLEPPVPPDAPMLPPVAPAAPPQITIGDIVVEIVNAPEVPTRAPLMSASRALRPAVSPAPRAGVRSKRGFGLGQM